MAQKACAMGAQGTSATSTASEGPDAAQDNLYTCPHGWDLILDTIDTAQPATSQDVEEEPRQEGPAPHHPVTRDHPGSEDSDEVMEWEPLDSQYSTGQDSQDPLDSQYTTGHEQVMLLDFV